ncbi:MAG: hypothetical protein RI911_883, partial [Candidatus Parcubacteria bacterium]
MNIITAIDASTELFISSFRSETLDTVMLAVTSLFSTPTVLTVLALLCALAILCRECRSNALTISGAIVLSFLVSESVKLFFMRVRPEAIPAAFGLEHTFSFPSSHSAIAAALFCAWGLIFWKQIRKDPVLKSLLAISIMAAMSLIAFSRAYLRVHYATDAIAGMFL